ncbi:glycosyltransferase [bacterium]|nr:glycosyltransferase [bacterium]
MNKPVFVISSPFDTYSGYGARARDVIKAIIELDKYDVKLLSQRWGNCAFGFCEDNPEWEYLLENIIEMPLKTQPDIWMQITIPNEFQAIGKYNIGVTAGIESTLCKPEWIDGINKMNTTWVSSTHAKTVFENSKFTQNDKQGNPVREIKLAKPVEVVFEGANLDIYKPLQKSEIKEINLDDVKESFCYLFVGHWMQGEFGHDRKNVSLLVKAFYETFKNHKGSKPALILKASTGVNSYTSRNQLLDRIKQIKETVKSSNLPNIYLLTGEFSDQAMNELYNHSKVKAMVSLTKGEGFGRPLLEFSLTGKPIIASNWSGHTDFLKSNMSIMIGGRLENVHKSAANNWLIPESQWFKPNDSEIGKTFKNVYKKYKQYIVQAKQQKNFSKSKFSFEQMKNVIDQELSKLPDFPSQLTLKMPNLGKTQLPTLQ